MENNTLSVKELKNRKLLLVLPVLILPFITLLFWSLGGGKGQLASAPAKENAGFNTQLPDPSFKEDSALNKLSYYDKAALDSLKLIEQIKKDPNYLHQNILEDSFLGYQTGGAILGEKKQASIGQYDNSLIKGNKEKVYEKLKLLERTINTPTLGTGNDQDMREFENYGSFEDASRQLQDAERMISQISTPAEPDPELKELGGMLENILDIQHPSRVQQRIEQASKKQRGKVFTVEREERQEPISSLQRPAPDKPGNSKMPMNQNSFFTSQQDQVTEKTQNALQAVVHQNQTIVNGSVVKLRLGADVMINGVLIPKNSFLFGIASLKAERLQVKIDNIQYQNSIFPVQLSVYDIDGIEGIYIPGAITREVAKASADRSIQTMGIAGLDDSWGAQAAGMGIEAAKSLLSKKVKLVTVMVKAGYRVLLYDEKQNNSK